MNARRAIRTARTRVNALDPFRQQRVDARPLRGPTLEPRIEAAGGNTQQATCLGNGMVCLVRAHELEDPDGIEPVSRANQAAAFAKISRSRRSCLFSRRKRASSCRSAVVRPS